MFSILLSGVTSQARYMKRQKSSPNRDRLYICSGAATTGLKCHAAAARLASIARLHQAGDEFSLDISGLFPCDFRV